jgi:hypothetical protein
LGTQLGLIEYCGQRVRVILGRNACHGERYQILILQPPAEAIHLVHVEMNDRAGVALIEVVITCYMNAIHIERHLGDQRLAKDIYCSRGR